MSFTGIILFCSIGIVMMAISVPVVDLINNIFDSNFARKSLITALILSELYISFKLTKQILAWYRGRQGHP